MPASPTCSWRPGSALPAIVDLPSGATIFIALRVEEQGERGHPEPDRILRGPWRTTGLTSTGRSGLRRSWALGVSIVDGAVTGPFELGPGAGDIHVAAIGWATVELDRAATELGAELADDVRSRQPRRAPRRDGPPLSRHANPRSCSLEPDTEGRLSGALARHGEGPVALYLRVASLATSSRAGLDPRRQRPARPGPARPRRLTLGPVPDPRRGRRHRRTAPTGYHRSHDRNRHRPAPGDGCRRPANRGAVHRRGLSRRRARRSRRDWATSTATTRR